MTNGSRKERGAQAQRIMADFWEPVYPWVQPVSGGAPGRDLLNTPCLSVEIKARRDFDPLAWLRQACRNSDPDEMPVVQWRPDGWGPAKVHEWPYMGRSGDLRRWWLELKLLRAWAQDVDKPGYAALLDTVQATLKEER